MPGLFIHNKDWVWEGRSLQGKFKVLLSSLFLLGSVLVFGQNCGVFNPNENIESKKPQLVSNADGIPYEGKLTIEVRDRVEPGETEEVTIHGGTPPYQLVASNPDIIIVPGSSSNQFFITIPGNAASGKFKLEATDDEGRTGTKEILILGINAFMYDPSSLAISENGQSLLAADTALGLIHEIDFEGELIQSIDHSSAVFFPTKIKSLPGGGLLSLNRNGSLFHQADSSAELLNSQTRPLTDFFYHNGVLILVAPRGNSIRVSYPQNFDFLNLEWIPIEVLSESIKSMGIDDQGRFWIYSGGESVQFFDPSGSVVDTKILASEITHVQSGEPFEGSLIGRVDSGDNYKLVLDPFEIKSILIDNIPIESNEIVQPFFNVPDLGLLSLVQKNYNRFIRIYKDTTNGTASEVLEWNSGGTKAQNFAHPCDIAIDNKDNIYLNDQSNNRVSKFSSDLEFLLTQSESFIIPRNEESSQAQCYGDIHLLLGKYPLISKGKLSSLANQQLSQPEKSQFQDHIYCTEGLSSQCTSDSDSTTQGYFNQLLDKMKDFGIITTASTSPDNNTAVVFGKFGGTMFVIQKPQNASASNLEIKEVSLRDQLGIAFADRIIDSAIGDNGMVYVLTGRAFENFHIHALNLAGQVQYSFAPPRVEDNDQGLSLPRALILDQKNQRILVSDAGIMLIRAYNSSDGAYIGTIGGAGMGELEFRRPMGLALNSKGDLIISDTGNNRVQVIPNYSDFLQ